MSRQKIVEFIHTANVLALGASGLGLLFATESVVTLALGAGGKGVARNCGAFSLVFAMLLSSLGPTHHGGYCLTMTLHFILMATNTMQLLDVKLPDGQMDSTVLVQAVFDGIMFVVMLGMLTSGGISDHHAKPRNKASAAGTSHKAE